MRYTAIVLVSLLFSLTSWSQVGPQIDGSGGAGLATVNPMESPAVNPAAITQLEEYYAGIQYHQSHIDNNTTLDQYSLVLTDSSRSGIGTGSLLYRYKDYERGGTQIREDMLQGSLAAYINSKLSLALTGYGIKTEIKNGVDYTQSNMDLSLLWVLTNKLALGFKTQAVFGADDDAVFLPSKVLPTGGIGAQYYITEMFIVRGDLYYAYDDNPDNSLSHHLGLEMAMRAGWRLRGGISIDERKDENRYSFGLGWQGPRLRFAYAYQKEYRQEYGGAHSVDFYVDF